MLQRKDLLGYSNDYLITLFEKIVLKKWDWDAADGESLKREMANDYSVIKEELLDRMHRDIVK